MTQTKTKRAIVSAVRAWCEEDPDNRIFLEYVERGRSKHDLIRVKVYGIDIKTVVDGTPRGGAETAAKKAVNSLNKKARRKIQAIIEGRGKIY